MLVRFAIMRVLKALLPKGNGQNVVPMGKARHVGLETETVDHAVGMPWRGGSMGLGGAPYADAGRSVKGSRGTPCLSASWWSCNSQRFDTMVPWGTCRPSRAWSLPMRGLSMPASARSTRCTASNFPQYMAPRSPYACGPWMGRLCLPPTVPAIWDSTAAGKPGHHQTETGHPAMPPGRPPFVVMRIHRVAMGLGRSPKGCGRVLVVDTIPRRGGL